MGRKYAVVIAFGLVVPLCGCGAADSGATFLPESFRQPAPRAEIEQPPDIHLIVRNNLFSHIYGGRVTEQHQCIVSGPSQIRWMDNVR